MSRYKLTSTILLSALLVSITSLAGAVDKGNLESDNQVVVGSVSVKNSNLGNFVMNTSCSKCPAATYQIVVSGVYQGGSRFSDVPAGTFSTGKNGRGGLLFVLDGFSSTSAGPVETVNVYVCAVTSDNNSNCDDQNYNFAATGLMP